MSHSSTTMVDQIIRRAIQAIDIEGTEQELKIENLTVLDGDNARYIVDFLRRHSHAVDKLYICCRQWSTTAVEIVRAFFITTMLGQINLRRGQLGNVNCARLLSGLHGNASVSKLRLRYNVGLEGAAGGRHLAALLQHNPQLKELRCGSFPLGVPGARALKASLRTNQSLQALLLRKCRLGDEGVVAIASALDENNRIQVLSLECNRISSNSLAHIVRLVKHKSLHMLILDQNPDLFAASSNDQNNMDIFFNALSRESKLQILSMNLCQLKSQMLTALVLSASLATSLSELNVYDRNQVGRGETLLRLLEIIPTMSTSLRRLHVNMDFTNQSVISSFQQNTSITHLYCGVNRKTVRHVEPLVRILKRNRKLHHANELLLLHHHHHEPPSNITVLPKGVWVKGIQCLAQDRTGATAVYSILRSKLVMWWAPKVVSTTNEYFADVTAAATNTAAHKDTESTSDDEAH